MGRFLGAAYKVLAQDGSPLSAREITARALSQGLLETSGKTPWQTMKSKLSTEILKKREASPFMRTGQGTFGLRQWKGSLNEFVADRYAKNLLEEEVVVFSASSLPKYLPGVGLHAIALQNGRELLDECRSMPRREAEEDLSVIQLVSVFIVRFGDQLLTYKRTKRLPESRLHGFYSLIFGGHLNPGDIPSLFNIFDPDDGRAFIDRELREEIKFPQDEGPPPLIYQGLLYDDSRPLSRQHLGIVYEVLPKSRRYEIGERGFLIDSKFESIEEILARRLDFENWSLLILEHQLRQSRRFLKGS